MRKALDYRHDRESSAQHLRAAPERIREDDEHADHHDDVRIVLR